MQVLLVIAVGAADSVAVASAHLAEGLVVMVHWNLVTTTEEIVQVLVLNAIVEVVNVDNLCRIICGRPQEIKVKVLLQEANNNAESEELDDPRLDTVDPVGEHVHF